jgi:hypothetical protein
VFRFKIIIANVMFDYLAVKSYFNKWTKLSIVIDFGIGIDQNSWYRTGIVSKPKKLLSPITSVNQIELLQHVIYSKHVKRQSV